MCMLLCRVKVKGVELYKSPMCGPQHVMNTWNCTERMDEGGMLWCMDQGAKHEGGKGVMKVNQSLCGCKGIRKCFEDRPVKFFFIEKRIENRMHFNRIIYANALTTAKFGSTITGAVHTA